MEVRDRMLEKANAGLQWVGYGTQCPARKGAHVQQVNRREMSWRTVLMGESERRPTKPARPRLSFGARSIGVELTERCGGCKCVSRRLFVKEGGAR